MIASADGNLWRTTPDAGGALPLRTGNAQITAMRTFPDGVLVAVGYSSGDLIAVDTTSWQQTLLLKARGAIRHIAFTKHGGIAVADGDDTIHVAIRPPTPDSAIAWIRFAARARDMAFSDDGLLVVACAGGTVWVYSAASSKLLYLPIETVDLTHVVLTGDAKSAIVFDDEGRVISIALEIVLKAM